MKTVEIMANIIIDKNPEKIGIRSDNKFNFNISAHNTTRKRKTPNSRIIDLSK